MRNISTIVVTYRTGPVLEACLRSHLPHPEVTELIIVDNGNPGAESALLDRLAAVEPKVRLLRPGRNIGFAAGCNLGAAQARAPFIAFANPDLDVPSGTYAATLDALAQHDDAWLCGGRLLDMDGNEQRGNRREICTPWRSLVELTRLDCLFPSHPYFRRLNLLDDSPVSGVSEVPTVSGAFMVMPRDRFDHLGGWDEHIFLHMEDVDLCLRVLKQGGKVIHCGDAPIRHYASTSDVSRCFVEWHKTRSTSYYFAKHFRGPYPGWSLALISAALWVRFALRALLMGPGDVAGLLRRLRD